MATLDYDEVKPRTYILYNDLPHECLENHVARTQKRKPQNQVRLRNLITGAVIPATFHASDTAEGIEIGKKDAKYLYNAKGEYWFCNPADPKERYTIKTDVLGDTVKWLKENTMVELRTWDNDDEEVIIGVKMPIKMVLEVKEAPPVIKGNTASGGNKLVTLETGAQVTTPLFIEAGEKIVINTDTGEYVERFSGE